MAMSETASPLKGRVTIRTVAEDAGVSVAAVSKVLRNAYGVSDALRANVQASIARLGYRPNTAARSMRGRTHTIGILLVEMANPFLPGLVRSISETLASEGYKCLIGVGEKLLKMETTLIDSMIDSRMDGIILIAPRLAGKKLENYATQIPLVAIGHHEPGAALFDTVNSDDTEGARIAVRSLIEAGHRRIHMVTLEDSEDPELEVFRQRETGYLQAMQAAGLAANAKIIQIRESKPPLEIQLNEILESNEATAIFCWSDIHAVELYALARAKGLRVPQDLAIVGYDNSPVAALSVVNLSSIDQGSKRIGELAAKTLISRIAGRKFAEHILIPPRYVGRSSV